MKKIKTNDKQILKINFARASKTMGSIALVAAIWFGTAGGAKATTAHAIELNESENTKTPTPQEAIPLTLPSQAEVKENLLSYFSEESMTFNINHLPLPKNSKSIKINFTFKTSQAQQELFRAAVEEFNNVFAVINPAYHFEANFSPSKKDLASIYNINIERVERFEDENMFGLATSLAQDTLQGIEGRELYSNKIQIANKAFLSSEKLTTVFKHEFMHTLGADDMKQPAFSTIMESLSENSLTHLTSNDVAFLTCLYKSTNAYTDEEIDNFIDTYEISNAFSWSISKSKLSQQFDLETLYNAITNGETNLAQLLQDTLAEKYSPQEISTLQQLLESKNIEISDFSQNTTLCELLQKNSSTSIHRFAEFSQGSLVVHNFRDIDNSQQVNLYHFETEFSNMSIYKGIFGDDATAYINLGDLVLQVEYSIDEKKNIDITPLAIYRPTNLSKEEYSQELSIQQQDNKEVLASSELSMAEKDF